MAVKIRFPDAHPETDSVDGGAAAVYTPGQPVVGATWDTAHDSPGTEASVADTHYIGDAMIRAFTVTDEYDVWRRQIVLFNNPGLSAGDTITAVTVTAMATATATATRKDHRSRVRSLSTLKLCSTNPTLAAPTTAGQ